MKNSVDDEAANCQVSEGGGSNNVIKGNDINNVNQNENNNNEISVGVDDVATNSIINSSNKGKNEVSTNNITFD